MGGKTSSLTATDAERYRTQLKALNTEVTVIGAPGVDEVKGFEVLTYGLADRVVPVNIGEIGEQTTPSTADISDAINKLIVNINGEYSGFFEFPFCIDEGKPFNIEFKRNFCTIPVNT